MHGNMRGEELVLAHLHEHKLLAPHHVFAGQINMDLLFDCHPDLCTIGADLRDHSS